MMHLLALILSALLLTGWALSGDGTSEQKWWRLMIILNSIVFAVAFAGWIFQDYLEILRALATKGCP